MQGRTRQIAHRSASDVGRRRLVLGMARTMLGGVACATLMAGSAFASEVGAAIVAVEGVVSFAAIEPVSAAPPSEASVAVVDRDAFVPTGFAPTANVPNEHVAEAAPGPASFARFDSSLPSEFSTSGRADDGELTDRTDVSSPFVMLEPRKLGPIVMEQPVRVYESDVTVKLRAPGRRRSFATVEVIF